MIAEQLKIIRKHKGLGLKPLSAILDIHANTLQAYESGRFEPNASRIVDICQALDCTPNELFGYEEV